MEQRGIDGMGSSKRGCGVKTEPQSSERLVQPDRPWCKYCGKRPRSKTAKENWAKRYPGYCSYDHQERHRLQLACEYLRTLHV